MHYILINLKNLAQAKWQKKIIWAQKQNIFYRYFFEILHRKIIDFMNKRYGPVNHGHPGGTLPPSSDPLIMMNIPC